MPVNLDALLRYHTINNCLQRREKKRTKRPGASITFNRCSIKLKQIHIHDLAFQQFVLEQCGLKINNTRVMLANRH